MARIVNWIAAVLFVALLAAPLAALIAAPPTALRANVQPSLIVDTDPAERDRIANILIANSPFGATLVRWKNRFDYHAVRFINTPDVISGEWPWLFYKQQFDNGRCLPEAFYAQGLDGIETMRLIAAGAGIDLAVSLSPDKSVVYPEKLGFRARVLAGCKLESAEAWRASAKAHGSSLIDHREPMLAPAAGGLQLYFATDTHWNQLGFGYVLHQLAMKLLGIRLPDPAVADLHPRPVKTDLRTIFLKLDEREPPLTLTDDWKSTARSRLSPGIAGAVVVHDSFYAQHVDLLRYLLPDGRFFNLNDGRSDEIAAAIRARPPFLLINSVERSFFGRFGPNGTFGLNGMLGKALLAANADASRSCVFAASAEADRAIAGLKPSRTPGSYIATSALPSVTVRLPKTEGRICIQVSFRAKAGKQATLLLPNLRGEPVFTTGRAIPFDTGGDRTYRLILPSSLAGLPVKLQFALRPKARISGLSVQTGVSSVP